MACNVATGHIEFANYAGPGTFPYMVPHESHTEFSEDDGQMLAEAFLERYGSKFDAFDECLTMLIVASGKHDETTISGCMQARRYMRKNWKEVRDDR